MTFEGFHCEGNHSVNLFYISQGIDERDGVELILTVSAPIAILLFFTASALELLMGD